MVKNAMQNNALLMHYLVNVLRIACYEVDIYAEWWQCCAVIRMRLRL